MPIQLPEGAAAVLRSARQHAALWRDEPTYRAAQRARLLRPYRVRQFGAFGHDSIVDRPTWIYGAPKIHVGADVMILAGAWLSAERMTWERPGPSIVIGDRSGIRAWVTLSASSGIAIGDDVVFGAQCTVVDCDHTWRDGHPNVLHNPVNTRPIKIGNGTWLGDRVTVLQGATIGERCAIGAHSVVRDDIPDGSIAAGIPARIIGRSADL
jgi:acetyltransferase-like isoleucine patch superfamily enzyme